MHYAASGGYAEVVRCLVEAGAKVDGVDIWGRCATCWGARGGHEGVVEELVGRGGGGIVEAAGWSVLDAAILAGAFDINSKVLK